MDRRKFIRNLLGTTAAVTIAPYLPTPVPGDVPGIGGGVVTMEVGKSTVWIDYKSFLMHQKWLQQRQAEFYRRTWRDPGTAANGLHNKLITPKTSEDEETVL